MTAEGDLVKEILLAVSAREFHVWRNNTGVFFQTFATHVPGLYRRGRAVEVGQVGSPDVIGFCRVCGCFVGIEVKTTKGVVSDDQRFWGQSCDSSGAIYGVVRSLDEAIALVDAHRRRC